MFGQLSINLRFFGFFFFFSVSIYLDICCVSFEAILVHNPIGLLAMRSTARVENERLSHTDLIGTGEVDGLVPPGCLPEPGCGRPICSSSGRIFLVLMAKEVPLILRRGSDLAFVCICMVEDVTHSSDRFKKITLICMQHHRICIFILFIACR